MAVNWYFIAMTARTNNTYFAKVTIIIRIVPFSLVLVALWYFCDVPAIYCWVFAVLEPAVLTSMSLAAEEEEEANPLLEIMAPSASS